MASDTATSFDAIKHTIEFYRNDLGKEFDYVVLLQPTSPLRTSHHLKSAIELLSRKQSDAIISVCEVDHSPLWSNTIPEDQSLSGFIRKEVRNARSQDLPKYYRINGAIYICKTSKLLEEETFFIDENSFAYVMGKEVSPDVDDMVDLEFANYLLSKR